MHPIVGTWDVRVKTPIGTIAAVYVFAQEPDGLTGTATAGAETVPLTAIACDGDNVTWRQAVTRPMRLNLDFAVVASGDTLAGHSRAGRLPRSAVTGTRRTA
ncbi:hypothetical protein [Dactylosporangium darangshiense]|uniref:Uncharacterized protein n=1 Tax=Dactylosporangium darangshiense TaxID=579108 RepID=A0ABP8CYL6_9ACTN